MNYKAVCVDGPLNGVTKEFTTPTQWFQHEAILHRWIYTTKDYKTYTVEAVFEKSIPDIQASQRALKTWGKL